jgi:hypothetical protein
MKDDKYKPGTLGTFKNLGEHYDGKVCEIIGIFNDEEGSLLIVKTKECLGASPSDIELEIHRFEFEPQN